MLPLVRIIALYKDERQAFNCIKFNQMFVNKIANPKDAVLLKLYKDNKRTQKQSGNSRDLDNVTKHLLYYYKYEHYTLFS